MIHINELSSFFFKFMIYYYISVDSCIYIYNSNTDHWIVKSPRVIYKNCDLFLSSLNYGNIKPEELNLKKIGKTRAYKFLNNQYKDIEETWEYSGMIFKSGMNITSDENKYNIVYYHGKTYPVISYKKSTNTFILREGKEGRFEVNVKNCAEIWRKIPGDITYSIYGKTII